MPLTKLDPKTALILIDLQQGIVAMPTAHPSGEVVARAAKLAEAFRSHGLPVVVVNVDGVAPGRAEQSMGGFAFPPGFSDIVPELNVQGSDHRETKRSWGAFSATGLRDYLQAQGVTQVVIAGIATSIGVETTARQAYEQGYNVTLAVDAMTDLKPEAHENSVSRIFPRLGETGTAAQVIDLLGAR
jgi:nicotinamidase-related amidase